MFRAAAIGAAALAGFACNASADIVAVNAKAAIFDAGRAAATLDGILPPMLLVPGNADYVTVPAVDGLVRAHPLLQWGGPDGNASTPQDSDIDSYLGISGLIHPRTLPLLGVFLGPDEAENPAPPRLDYYLLGSNLESFAPPLGQSFFIGDGWTDGGVLQQFQIPLGATRFSLGLADAGYFTGAPTAYIDNTGEFVADVQFHLVPTPGTLALLGFGGLLASRRRR